MNKMGLFLLALCGMVGYCNAAERADLVRRRLTIYLEETGQLNQQPAGLPASDQESGWRIARVEHVEHAEQIQLTSQQPSLNVVVVNAPQRNAREKKSPECPPEACCLGTLCCCLFLLTLLFEH